MFRVEKTVERIIEDFRVKRVCYISSNTATFLFLDIMEIREWIVKCELSAVRNSCFLVSLNGQAGHQGKVESGFMDFSLHS